MNRGKQKHPFVFNYGNKLNSFEYLGSDGLPTAETYDVYLIKCKEFKRQARKYAKGNLNTKTSILHQLKCGYESSEQLDEEILMERQQLMKDYERAFDLTFFDKDPSSMFECFTGKSKSIRAIRELHQDRNEDLSEDFDKKTGSWFTRLEKALAKLKTLTPSLIKRIELGDKFVEEGEFKYQTEEVPKKISPCVC